MPVDDARETKRVLLLGAGFIGSHIARDLVRRGYDVVALTRRRPSGYGAYLLEGAEILVGDAGVTSTLSHALDGTDHVIFALSSLMPGEADQNTQLDMFLLLGPLLELLNQLGKGPGVPLTLLSSGGTVYGCPSKFPTPEDAPTNPASSYGITKLTVEKHALRHAMLRSMPVRVLRIANAYGPGQLSLRGQGIIGAALERCVTGQPLTLFGDGSVARDFVYVEDVAAAVADLVARPGGPAIVNVASGTSVSLDVVLELVQATTGRLLSVERMPPRAFDVPRVQLDISRLRSLVNFTPRPLCEGVKDAWEYLLTGVGGSSWAEAPVAVPAQR